ncbi:hypothetical protein [Actinomadura oligospora]|uniref:hypothetical protein n=1 Tax=Actinomadura oligospora TaxID=111804 RepID=UPI00047B07A2|nr:hypothetical protein [Actinomadura oligospora]
MTRSQDATPRRAGSLLLLGVVVATGVTALSQFTGMFRDAPRHYEVEPVEYQRSDAARLLLAAADGMAKTSGKGDLWYRRSSVGETVVVRSPGRPGVKYAVRVEQDTHLLASADEPLPARDGQGRPVRRKDRVRSSEWSDDQVTVRPASPADEAEWKADGEPGSGALHTGEPARSPGPGMAGGGSALDFGVDEARRLPADPAELRAALLNHAARSGHERIRSTDEYLYSGASVLLVDVPVDDDVRVATYRLLASLRGVRAVTAADATGRRLQGVALRRATPENGTIDSELLIDPADGRLAAGQDVVVTPGTRNANLRPGDLWRYEIVRQAGWANGRARSRPHDHWTPPTGRDEP